MVERYLPTSVLSVHGAGREVTYSIQFSCLLPKNTLEHTTRKVSWSPPYLGKLRVREVDEQNMKAWGGAYMALAAPALSGWYIRWLCASFSPAALCSGCPPAPLGPGSRAVNVSVSTVKLPMFPWEGRLSCLPGFQTDSKSASFLGVEVRNVV